MRQPWPVLLLAAVCSGALGCQSGDSIQGSGATFPAPLYRRWFLEYYKENPTVRVNYTPIGSGAGIRQFTSGLVLFGASDAGMSKDEIKEVEREHPEYGGVRLLPMTAGSIVLSYNLPGVDKATPIRLSRRAYLKIFKREITKWTDDEIQKENPKIKLPQQDITVVTRADSSGTTYAFTNHLEAVSEDERVGVTWSEDKKKKELVGKTIKWKESISAQGNDGVAALIQLTPGAIGYLEFGYADLANLPMAVLENHYGNYVTATPENGRLALEEVKIPPDLQIKVPDPSKRSDAYPIVTYTWVICRNRYSGTDAAKGAALKKVLRYCAAEGQKMSNQLGYLALPEDVAEKVKESIEKIEIESPTNEK
jgi:phosphate transport system substrate-binding protein